MTVRELIEKLSQLDQDKQIKGVSAYGWEFEEETTEEIDVVEYKDTKDEICDFYPVNDNGENKDFYIIR